MAEGDCGLPHTNFDDGWRKGEAVGVSKGIDRAQEYYATLAEEEAKQHANGDGEIWIARRIADLIRANVPPEAEREG